MAKQTFTTGQVLTAAQMTSLQETAMGGGSATAKTTSYVLTAADAGTVVAMSSASPTTVTVNTGLFSAGDTVTIQNRGSGTVTVTAGTATVTTAGSLVLPQWDGGVLYFTSASAAIFYEFIQTGATSPLTTKGDLWTYTTTDARLASSGVNNQVLTVDTSTASGLKWAAPTSGITGYTLLNAGGTALTGATTITVSGISAKALMVIVENASSANASSNFSFRLNGDTAANYTYAGFFLAPGSTYAANLSMGDASYSGITSLPFASMSGSATSVAFGSLAVGLADTTGWKNVSVIGGAESDGSNLQRMRANQGIYEASAAITSVSVVSSTGNFDNGTIYVLGAN